MAQTMFERYGGFAKVSQIISSFYDKMLDSPITSPYFAHADMQRLIDHQARFVAFLMGGPASYTSDHLERVHAHLGITEEAFRVAVALLTETLEEFGITAEDVKQIANELTTRKHLIVTRV